VGEATVVGSARFARHACGGRTEGLRSMTVEGRLYIRGVYKRWGRTYEDEDCRTEVCQRLHSGLVERVVDRVGVAVGAVRALPRSVGRLRAIWTARADELELFPGLVGRLGARRLWRTFP